MVLDIYAGSMARFFLRSYQTPLQRYADKVGAKHSFLTPPPKGLSVDKTKSKLFEFKHNLHRLIGEEYPDISQWNDRATDYHVRQLHYACLDSLYIVSRCAYHLQFVRPNRIDDDQENYPDFPELSEEEENDGAIKALSCHLYLPSKGRLFVETKDILERDIDVTSLTQLKFGLGIIAQKVWGNKIDSEKWVQQGAVLHEEDAECEDIVMHNAQYAFAVLHLALGFALNFNVPIILEFDYKRELIQDGQTQNIDPVLVDMPLN